MEAINETGAHHLSPQKDEAFWQDHYSIQQSSGLSRAAYCRKHAINYDRFTYWVCKWRIDQRDTLIPVKIKTSFAARLADQSNLLETLCTLDLKNGHRLRIHDNSVLSLLLDRWK